MRIVAGRLGGRRLAAPRDDVTRPTSDRVRESLFAILGPLTGDVVLDLYAGTGALALEALSRGASRAVLVESRRAALDSLRANVEALGVEGECTVLPRPVERLGATLVPAGPFDVVFVDPPYAVWNDRDQVKSIASVLGAPGVLSGNARIVLEHASRTPTPVLAGFAPTESRRYGDTTLTFCEVSA
jgi:16S rRNA (guanine966-N2)-methyltransferase